MRVPIALAVLLACSACASTGNSPRPSAKPAAAQPTTATPPAAARPVAARKAAQATPDSEVARWAKSHGYVLTTIGEKHLWCKEEETTGSRIAQRTCLSEDQLTTLRQANERNKEAFLNNNNGCPNATCTKGN